MIRPIGDRETCDHFDLKLPTGLVALGVITTFVGIAGQGINEGNERNPLIATDRAQNFSGFHSDK